MDMPQNPLHHVCPEGYYASKEVCSVDKDLTHSQSLVSDSASQPPTANRKLRIIYALCSSVFLYLLLVPVLVAPTLADYVETWPISYEYSGAIYWPSSQSVGDVLITLDASITVSAAVTMTSPTNQSQVVNIPDMDAHGFSSIFAMDEIGEYETKETYTLTIEVEVLGTTQNFTHTDTRKRFNSTPSLILFQMNDMHINNYSSQVSPPDTVKIDNITPPLSRPGDTISMDVIALRDIVPFECIIDSVSLAADWHKTSSLTLIEDNEPPTITHSCIAEPIQPGSPIEAEVTDNLKVDSVFLYFKDASSSGFQQIEMTLTDQPDTYVGYIPLNASDGWAYYYFGAEDVAGNSYLRAKNAAGSEPPPPNSYYDVLVASIMLGDVNDDAVVDDDDATMVLESAVGLAGLTDQQQLLGDVSGDDTASSFDAGLIMQYVEGLRDSFPVVGGALPSSGAVGVSVSDTIGPPGASITVPINISNSTGEPEIIGIDVTLTYDSDVLTAIGAVTGGTIASGWNMAYSICNGQIIIGMANHTKLTGEGAFVNVDFSVSEAAVNGQGSLLMLPNVSFNEGSVSADKTNGLFEVADQIELVFYPGWNFFSTCFDIKDDQLLSVLAPIEGLWRAVWSYDASLGWKRHVYGGPDSVNDLHYIVPGKGYLIYMDMDSNTALTIAGNRITDKTISLQQGWNLIGSKSSMPQSVEDVSFSVDYTSISTYDRGSWLRCTVGALSFLNNLDQLKPGKGYWVYVK